VIQIANLFFYNHAGCYSLAAARQTTPTTLAASFCLRLSHRSSLKAGGSSRIVGAISRLDPGHTAQALRQAAPGRLSKDRYPENLNRIPRVAVTGKRVTAFVVLGLVMA